MSDDRYLEAFGAPSDTRVDRQLASTWQEYALVFLEVRRTEAMAAQVAAVEAHGRLARALAELEDACALAVDAGRLVEGTRWAPT